MKIRDHIRWVDTGKRKPINKKAHFSVDATYDILTNDAPVAVEMIARLNLGRAVFCPEGEKEEALETAIKMLQEDLYGEFRGPLIELEIAIMEQDDCRANSLLREIREGMGL